MSVKIKNPIIEIPAAALKVQDFELSNNKLKKCLIDSIIWFLGQINANGFGYDFVTEWHVSVIPTLTER